MLLHVPLLFYLLIVSVPIQGFVTISPDCSLDNSQLYCNCKPYDGIKKRYGNDFLLDILNRFKNQSNPNKVKKVILSNCDTPFKFTLDLNKLEKSDYWSDLFVNVQEIVIENSSPFNAYFSGQLHNGDLTVTFRNIQGHDDFSNGLKGSVVLTGGVDYCTKSCQTTAIDQTGPPSQWTTCNECIPSNIRFNFVNVDHVYLKHFGIAAYEHTKDEGHAILHAERVQTFRIDEPFLSRVQVDNIDAAQCWLRDKYGRNPYTDQQVDCNSYGSGSSIGGEFIVVIALLTFALQA